MIDFTTLQGLTIPEGVVTQITDESGRVIWAVANDKPIVLEVEKITSDTYAGETTYTGESFILLDIYPKNSNSTVNVTYGGLTKTLTFSGTNAQQVFFGTFNGVTDSVTTPASSTLTIEGDYRGFGVGEYAKSSKSSDNLCNCITAVTDLGAVRYMPVGMFENCSIIPSVTIPSGVTDIREKTFNGCSGIQYIYIPATVRYIAEGTGSIVLPPFVKAGHNNPITVDSRNQYFHIDGNCLIRKSDNALIAGFADSIIPSYVTRITNSAFRDRESFTLNELPSGVTEISFGAFDNCKSITLNELPSGVTKIENYTFYGCAGLTSMTIGNSVTSIGSYAFYGCSNLTSVTFANTSGWYVTKTQDGDISTGTAVDLSDAVNNATLITDTYNTYYWYRQ